MIINGDDKRILVVKYTVCPGIIYFLQKIYFRCWTVMKEDGEMLSAKQEPRLVLISVTCEDGYLTLNAPEMKALRIPIELPRTNSVRNCRCFGIEAQGRDCGEEAAHWITTFLNGGPYRLAHYEPNMVAYAEGSPILLISEASLDDLNSRLEKKVAITNFRPNIVVTGCTPYEEDSWSEILIGNVQMKGRMSCPSYRKCPPSEQHAFKSHPPFGWLYGIEKTGTLAVGDPVYKIIK
ncbi:hypothetical protein JD844_025196 [Phrynosoma platyrhinos]|uniref:MOSC domain-containing protein n=1 Tax=Phrynosoma platyrhinos TaxID=52577 RepID=A0ABQ7SZH5_PHRPL|nr:hypothetical protein JD844_025196 [Phrynosoma platyrhinos]